MSNPDQQKDGKAVYEARPPLPETAYARRPLPAPRPQEPPQTERGALVLFERVAYALALVGGVMGAFDFVFMMKHAKSAPQEAAGAAMALCWAVIPYVIARAITGYRRAG